MQCMEVLNRPFLKVDTYYSKELGWIKIDYDRKQKNINKKSPKHWKIDEPINKFLIISI